MLPEAPRCQKNDIAVACLLNVSFLVKKQGFQVEGFKQGCLLVFTWSWRILNKRKKKRFGKTNFWIKLKLKMKWKFFVRLNCVTDQKKYTKVKQRSSCLNRKLQSKIERAKFKGQNFNCIMSTLWKGPQLVRVESVQYQPEEVIRQIGGMVNCSAQWIKGIFLKIQLVID